VGTISTEDEEEATTELATATGGDGLRALFGPRLSLGEPSPPIGGVLDAGGELAVVTVNSPTKHRKSRYNLFYIHRFAVLNLTFNLYWLSVVEYTQYSWPCFVTAYH
jgi:hypothetical protein